MADARSVGVNRLFVRAVDDGFIVDGYGRPIVGVVGVDHDGDVLGAADAVEHAVSGERVGVRRRAYSAEQRGGGDGAVRGVC